MQRLKDLIEDHLKRTNKSMRQFAREVGVSSPTISNLLSLDDPPTPELKTLINMARVMDIDLITLVRAVYPDDVPDTINLTDVQELFDSLSPAQQTLALDILKVMLNQNENSKELG